MPSNHRSKTAPLLPGKLHGKGLAAAACAENGDVGVFVDARIKDVHDDKRIVVFVDAEQDTVVVTQLIRRERIAACRAQRQHIPLAAFKDDFDFCFKGNVL